MNIEIEGFYVAYLSGEVGQGLGVFVFRKGVIAGADVAGVTFNGKYAQLMDGGISVSLSVKTPPNIVLIQGGTSGPHGLETSLNFEIPPDFSSGSFFRIDGPRGPVNTKLVKLRDLDE